MGSENNFKNLEYKKDNDSLKKMVEQIKISYAIMLLKNFEKLNSG